MFAGHRRPYSGVGRVYMNYKMSGPVCQCFPGQIWVNNSVFGLLNQLTLRSSGIMDRVAYLPPISLKRACHTFSAGVWKMCLAEAG